MSTENLLASVDYYLNTIEDLGDSCKSRYSCWDVSDHSRVKEECESINLPRSTRDFMESICVAKRPCCSPSTGRKRARSVLLHDRKSDPSEHEEGCDGEPKRKELTEE